MKLLKTQTCPNCGDEVDDCYAEWEDGTHVVTCGHCGEEYQVKPVYEFKGFEVQKLCHACGEFEEECYCD